MPKFEVTFTYTYMGRIDIDADSAEQAKEMVEAMGTVKLLDESHYIHEDVDAFEAEVLDE